MTEAAKPASRLAGAVRALARRASRMFSSDADAFLRQIQGLIHVGANLGQEREEYAAHRLKVLWVEPNPEVFERLDAAVRLLPGQRACCHLVTDTDDRDYVFNISSNEGQSSSILELAGHRELWPEVSFVRSIRMRGVTLGTLLQKEGLRLGDYQALVLDTQGSELHVLRGASPLLKHFQFIKAEVADFESYEGCCRLPDMDAYLGQRGFRRLSTRRLWGKEGVGSYFEVVYAAEPPR